MKIYIKEIINEETQEEGFEFSTVEIENLFQILETEINDNDLKIVWDTETENFKIE
jgi:hypothetical protein